MDIENPSNMDGDRSADESEQIAVAEMSEQELENELQSAVDEFEKMREDIRLLANSLDSGTEIEELAGELTPEQEAELQSLQKKFNDLAVDSIDQGIKWAIPGLIAMQQSLENSELHGALYFIAFIGSIQSGYPALKAAWTKVKKDRKEQEYTKRKETERTKIKRAQEDSGNSANQE